MPPAPTPQFGKPSASEVQATSALLACAYLYTGDAADIAEAGFGYKPAASAQTGYTMVEITPDDSSLSARLEELTPETAYEFYAYLVIDGKNYTSERVVFTTLKEGEQPELRSSKRLRRPGFLRPERRLPAFMSTKATAMLRKPASGIRPVRRRNIPR